MNLTSHRCDAHCECLVTCAFTPRGATSRNKACSTVWAATALTFLYTFIRTLIRRFPSYSRKSRRPLVRLNGRKALQIEKFIRFTPMLLAMLFSLPAEATLGGPASSTQTDQLQMKATLRMSPGTRFTVHEMALPSGTTVREYVTMQGTVFAVAWKGPRMPDLRQLMGTYFDQYLQAVPPARGGHAGVAVSQPDLVVHSMGHTRAFSGHAYLPPLLPADVPVDELQ